MADANFTRNLRTFDDEGIARVRDALLIGLSSYGEIERLSAAQELQAQQGKPGCRKPAGNALDRHIGYGWPVCRGPVDSVRI